MEAGNGAENGTSTASEWPTEASDVATVSPDAQSPFPFMGSTLDESSSDMMDVDEVETESSRSGNDGRKTPTPASSGPRESAARPDRMDKKDGDASRRFPPDWI